MKNHKHEQRRQHTSSQTQHPTLKFPKKGNLAKAQDKDSKLATINMFQDIKEDMTNV